MNIEHQHAVIYKYYINFRINLSKHMCIDLSVKNHVRCVTPMFKRAIVVSRPDLNSHPMYASVLYKIDRRKWKIKIKAREMNGNSFQKLIFRISTSSQEHVC